MATARGSGTMTASRRSRITIEVLAIWIPACYGSRIYADNRAGIVVSRLKTDKNMPTPTLTASRIENNDGNAPAGWLAPANAPILARVSPVSPPSSPRPPQSMKSKFLSVL